MVVIGPWSIGAILVGKQPTIIISTITSPPFLRGCMYYNRFRGIIYYYCGTPPAIVSLCLLAGESLYNIKDRDCMSIVPI